MPKTKEKLVEPFNYDPNIRWADQTVRVTLGTWQYRTTREVVINGNCKGFDIFDCIVEAVLLLILKECDYPEDCRDCDDLNEHYDGSNRLGFMMQFETKTEIKELWCEPDQDDLERWISNLIIGVEIIDIQPEKK